MVRISNVLVALVAVSAAAAFPVEKRIAQTIADSTTLWVAACVRISSLLPPLQRSLTLHAHRLKPVVDPSATQSPRTPSRPFSPAAETVTKQDAADQMVDLAKTLNNDPDMIRLAQIFVQQPRNSVSGPLHRSAKLVS
jgi:hypothetical protein